MPLTTERLVVPSLFCVMENDSQGIPRAAMHAANAVPQIDAIVASRTLHWPVSSCKNDRLPLIRMNHFRLRLCPWLLFHQNKFAAFPIAPRLPQQKHHLQRKTNLAIKILMQTVVPVRFVVKHQRRGLFLAGLVTNL